MDRPEQPQPPAPPPSPPDAADQAPPAEEQPSASPSGNESLYRKAALERLSAAGEHIDDLLRVSRPSDSIIVATLLLLALVVLFWSFLGRIPVMVEGEGMIQPREGIVQVAATGGGTLVSETPAEGRRVEKGDFLAKIVSREAQQSLENARERERQAQADYDAQKQIYQATVQTSETAENSIVGFMRENITQLKEMYQDRKRDYQTTQELFHKGYMTRSDVISSEGALVSAFQDINQAQISLARERVSRQADLIEKQLALRDKEEALAAAREDREKIEASIRDSTLLAPAAGLVREFTWKRGDIVPAGANVCLVESSGPPAVTYLFIATDDAKKVAVGAPVQIEVASYPSDIYGKLLGRVTKVDELPASQPLIAQACGYSNELVQRISSEPSSNRVAVDLETEIQDGRIVYRKASGGSPFPVSSGMICSGSAVTENRIPITLVIPALKKLFGLSEM